MATVSDFNLQLLMKCSQGSKSPFYELNISAPLCERLDYTPRKAELKELDYGDSRSPKGVIFREEDIGDGESSDPYISDLLNSAKLNAAPQTSDKLLDTLSVVEGTRSFFSGDVSE